MFPSPRADRSSIENLWLTCTSWGLWPWDKRNEQELARLPHTQLVTLQRAAPSQQPGPEDSCSRPQKCLLRASPHSPGLPTRSYIHLTFLPRAVRGWQASASGALSSCSALSSFPKLPCTYSPTEVFPTWGHFGCNKPERDCAGRQESHGSSPGTMGIQTVISNPLVSDFWGMHDKALEIGSLQVLSCFIIPIFQMI